MQLNIQCPFCESNYEIEILDSPCLCDLCKAANRCFCDECNAIDCNYREQNICKEDDIDCILFLEKAKETIKNLWKNLNFKKKKI